MAKPKPGTSTAASAEDSSSPSKEHDEMIVDDIEAGEVDTSIMEEAETSSSGEGNKNLVVRKASKVSTPISILIGSLVKNLCSAYEPDPQKVEILYEIICENLFKMDMIDESYNMAEFEGMRSEYQKAFQILLKSSLNGDQPSSLHAPWPNTSDSGSSHYLKEFDEIGYIAGGGFGQVYKVKHKLDGTEYAVKKIAIRADGIDSVRNYLSEVKTFASVNHSNIVQYKAAWLELGPPSCGNNMIVDTDTKSNSNNMEKHLDEEYIYHQEDVEFSDDHVEDSSFEVDFEHSAASVNRSKTNKSQRVKRNSASEGAMAVCKLDRKEIREIQMQQKGYNKWATLYIQMALCQSTLKQWLEIRNDNEKRLDMALVPVTSHVRNETIYEVLNQLVKGLKYIHSKGIVHHDIKPSNVFVQIENGNILVQLGDFGLACPLQSVRHSLALGTKLYAAPEQLAGKCNPKSDMYSLGIVLFELVERFRTDMERVEYINDLRKGKLPTHVHVQHPQLAQIICQLVSKNPQNRPDASTLLTSMTESSDGYVQELECKLIERDEEIMRLKQLLKSAGVKSV